MNNGDKYKYWAAITFHTTQEDKSLEEKICDSIIKTVSFCIPTVVQS